MLKTVFKTASAMTFALSASASFAQVNLTSNAAGAGTAGALSATSLVENAAERGIANIQMKDGQTGTKYIMALAEGKIDLASGPFILPFLMAKAAGPYSNLEKDAAKELGHSIAMLYPYTFSIFTLYAYDSKGISGWDDLKGMKVLNGPPRGTAALNSRSLIQLFTGLKPEDDYDTVTVNWSQMPSAIIDGTVDAAVIPAMFPGPRVTQASAAGDDMFRGKAVPGGDLVNKSMDEELAYQLTKSHIENLDEIKAMAPFMATLNFGDVSEKANGLCGANIVKFHPGAVRAWEEAGHTLPDCSKP